MRTRRLHAADLTRKHWTEGTAARVLAAWRESGLSTIEFAHASGVSAERLRRWRHRLDEGATPTTAASMALVPAAVVRSARVALRLPCGVEVEGDAEALPVQWVAALVRELGRA